MTQAFPAGTLALYRERSFVFRQDLFHLTSPQKDNKPITCSHPLLVKYFPVALIPRQMPSR